MAVAEFPMQSLSTSNPFPLVFYQFPNVYQMSFTEYDDGGRDFKMQNGGIGILRWFIFYDGMLSTEAAILDTHAESAKLGPDGTSAFTFNFRDRDTTTLYTGVRYEKYDRPAHKLKDIQQRTVQLVKFP